MRTLMKHDFPHGAVMKSALVSLRLSNTETGATQHELKLQKNWIQRRIQNDKVHKKSGL